ncbi:MAG: hypothetical protein JRJ85_10100 [Deltaproteobacteria bacterium]|nr:hypothetical protein [Deltaproteobacteria bacterium]
MQPGPAPRFSRTEAEIQGPPLAPSKDPESVLADCGFSSDEIEALKSGRII